MDYYWYVVIFILGTIIGSFLNVVIYRLHTGRSTNGRSHCLSCGAYLHWYELIPLLSYVALRGRCRSCASHIPLRYLAVELLTAFLFILLWHMYRYDLVLLVLGMIMIGVLVVVFVYDLRHMIIPDEAVVLLTLTGVLMVVYHALHDGGVGVVVDAVVAGLCGAAFFGIFWLISGGRWMGLGDAKLAFPLCLMLGVWGAISAIVLSFWIGAAVSLGLIALQHIFKAGTTHLPFLQTPLRMKSEVPFAPFLILGFLGVYFFHVDLFTSINILAL